MYITVYTVTFMCNDLIKMGNSITELNKLSDNVQACMFFKDITLTKP